MNIGEARSVSKPPPAAITTYTVSGQTCSCVWWDTVEAAQFCVSGAKQYAPLMLFRFVHDVERDCPALEYVSPDEYAAILEPAF